MTRIKTISFADSDEALRLAREAQHAPLSERIRGPGAAVRRRRGGIVAAHSLIPEALHHAFATFGALMSPDLPLDRRQHEMIATVVSATNRTYYCTVSHTEFLRRAASDEALSER